MPELTIELELEDRKLLVAAAESLGIELRQYVESLTQKEARRLFHIERCKPKAKPPKQPVGRPPIAEEERQARQLGKDLRGIYLKLKEMYGDLYDELFSRQEQEMETAIAQADLKTLIWFNEKQPWLRRNKNER